MTDMTYGKNGVEVRIDFEKSKREGEATGRAGQALIDRLTHPPAREIQRSAVNTGDRNPRQGGL